MPGAWAEVDGQVVISYLSHSLELFNHLISSLSLVLFLQKVTFYGSSLVEDGAAAKGPSLEIPGASRPALVTKSGLVLFGNDGKSVSESRAFGQT